MKTVGFTTPRFDGPECLGEGGSGAWYDAGIIPEEARSGVIAEVLENGGIEPIRDSKSLVTQVFKRAVIDLTREHSYPKTEALGLSLAGRLIVASEALFPAVKNFRPENQPSCGPGHKSLWAHPSHRSGCRPFPERGQAAEPPACPWPGSPACCATPAPQC